MAGKFFSFPCFSTNHSCGRGLLPGFLLVLALGLSACGGGGSSSSPVALGGSHSDGNSNTSPEEGGGGEGEGGGENPGPSLDEKLASIKTALSLTGDPATPRGAIQRTPDQDLLIKLGQLLFFSHSLSGNLTSSCATCHHPDFAGSDRLSLGVGVAPVDAAAIGPERSLNDSNDLDPAADLGPNMHRNSQTVFNSALFDRSLLFDGRVFVEDEAVVPGGQGQNIRTPESGSVPDVSDANSLLEVMSKFPLTNHNEMRAYLFDEPSQEAYRHRLAKRLRGELDYAFLSAEGPQNWLDLFRNAFNQPAAPAEDMITLLNIQRALAAYIESMIFVDTPWKAYLEGNTEAISDQAKEGALLFYTSLEDGGLGCAACHSGDFFTDEKFYNVGFPQLGRGFQRAEGDDIGRWNSTRRSEDKYAFRVPSLLNIALTGPYGHAGSFDTLADTLQYHAHPREAVDHFDFSLQQLAQFQSLSVTYPKAESHTRTTISSASFDLAEPLLPRRSLSETEISQLIAFMNSLSDDCVGTPSCRNQWTPAAAENPDGNLLVRNQNPTADPVPPLDPDPDGEIPSEPGDYPKQVPLAFAAEAPAPGFPGTQGCPATPATTINTGMEMFVLRSVDPLYGINDFLGQPLHPHGFDYETWGAGASPTLAQTTMFAGGVSAAYLDDDCWLDLAYAGGQTSGMVFYMNRGSDNGFDAETLLADDPGGQFTGVAMVDLNGDYKRELVFGNLRNPSIPVYSPQDGGFYHAIAQIPMSRYTYGISFGDYNNDGYPEVFFGHWFLNSNALTAPVFWRNLAGGALEHSDAEAHLSDGDYISQFWNFSPQFADFNGDNFTDLVVTSDFGTSVVLQNKQDGTFDNITDRTIITDENGMGSSLGDFDNDGDLDWFVSSIYDPDQMTDGNWGVTGNRLYRNNSTATTVSFEDVTSTAGVADGNWGWGACFADFNNDGFLDIFHVNGFGNYPEDIVPDGEVTSLPKLFLSVAGEYLAQLPRLFINNGDGSFDEKGLPSGLVAPNDGRGISCADLDRDGDIDLALLNHSHGLQIYTNQVGHGAQQRFLTVQLVGASPNTEALGSKVVITADTGKHGVQTQTRVRLANTNFNGQNPPDLHFGLGEATSLSSFQIHWKEGPVWSCSNINTNQFLSFDQRTPEAYPNCSIL